MRRLALIATLTLGLAAAAQAAGPAATRIAPAPSAATPVVEVVVGGGYYYGRPYRPYYYRPYWRPWYYYGGPVYYEAPAYVVLQPPPQPVWTGTGVIWLFPGAPQ